MSAYRFFAVTRGSYTRGIVMARSELHARHIVSARTPNVANLKVRAL